MIKNLKKEVFSAHLVAFATKVPIIRTLLRPLAHRFEEGSIVKISRGMAAGMLWKRYHRYVNAYWLGNYELPLQLRLALELTEGDTFFDIGANAGFFSLIAARIVGDRGRVIAFEPLPVNVETIEEQCKINNLKNCSCVPAALGSKDEIRELIVPMRGDEKSSLPTARLIKGSRSQDDAEEILYSHTVSVTSLDSFVEREGMLPDLVKIDVEGGEGDVLSGGESLLRSNRPPRLLIETHGRSAAEEVDRQLRDAGYRFYSLRGKDLPNALKERHFLAYPPHEAGKPRVN